MVDPLNTPIQFQLVTPETMLLAREVKMVIVPASEGKLGVLPGHAPVVSTLAPGIVEIYDEDLEKVSTRYFVGGGFTEVLHNRCVVLAENAMDVKRIRAKDVLQELKDAEAALDKAEDEMTKDECEARCGFVKQKIIALESIGMSFS